MSIENVLFFVVQAVIIYVSWKLGFAEAARRINQNLPQYKSLMIQHNIITLAKMGYVKLRENKDNQIELVTIAEIEGNAYGSSKKDSDS